MSIYELEEFEAEFGPARYDIHDLYVRSSFDARTVYFYIQQGLIPKAIGSGPAARYTYEHVVRLQVLRVLKERGLMLREIRLFLNGSTVRELHRIAQDADPTGVIRSIRHMLYRPMGSPPPGMGRLTRLTIADGIELFVSRRYLARAAVKREELVETIGEILGA